MAASSSIYYFWKLSVQPIDLSVAFGLKICLVLLAVLFCLVVIAVQIRFEWINELLKRNFQTEIDEKLNETISDDSSKACLLTTLASLHDLLCSTVSLINICFSLTIASYICSILITLIFSLFGLYVVLFTHTYNPQNIGFSLSVNVWNFYQLCLIFLTVCVSSFSTREAKSTTILLHKALLYQDNELIQKKVN